VIIEDGCEATPEGFESKAESPLGEVSDLAQRRR
jgi:hypothetical protein